MTPPRPARRGPLPARLASLLLALLLGGCASTEFVRGELRYDPRHDIDKTPVLLPPPPDAPRYRYAGELTGQANFESRADRARDVALNVFKWIVGLFDDEAPLRLQRPQHGAVDATGRVYVVDTGLNGVMVFDPLPPEGKSAEEGGHLKLWTAVDERTQFAGPVAMTLAWDGEILVSDARLGFVARLDPKGEGRGRIGAGLLQRPTGLAFDPASGLLYVADTVAREIKVFDREGRLVRRFGADVEGDEALNAPAHLAYARGRLYVSDALDARVLVFDAEGRRLGTLGQRGLYVGNLTRPKGVASGAGGITYVVESYYGHLLAFDEAGRLLLGLNGSGLPGDRFQLPAGVWTDDRGHVYLADMFNGRVVIFRYLGAE